MKILKLFVFCIVYLLISSCNRSVSEGNSGKYDIDKVLNKSEPITINIWHYYGATQKEKFDNLIDKEYQKSWKCKRNIFILSRCTFSKTWSR